MFSINNNTSSHPVPQSNNISQAKKPPTFDENTGWQDYLVQFKMVAAVNNWDDHTKAYELATNLRGVAQGIVTEIEPLKRFDYTYLVSALTSRFDPVNHENMYKVQMNSYYRKSGQTLPEMAQDIRRITSLAYPTAPVDIRNQLGKDCLICNFKVTHKFTIANIDVPAVIGYDFLHQYECTLELGKGVLIIGQNYIHCIKESQTESVFKVFITEKLTIPPNTEVITSCAIKGDASSIMNATIKALSSKHTDNLLIAKGVVDPSCGQIPIRMANITDFEQIIHPDTHVALCEAVEVNFDSAHADINKLMNVTSFDESKEIPSHLTDLRERSSELLSEDQISQLDKLLIKYDTTFSKNKSDLGRTSAIKHTISTGNAKLIKQAPRRLPLSKRDEVNDEIQRLLQCGVIEPSKSPWASCIVPVTKKSDDSTRICIDFRPLKNITKHDSYPLIRIDDALDALRGCKWLSVMDLFSGYWQVEMDEKDKEKTAFTSNKRLFHFNVMPMGLCNSVATFQRLMEYILAGLNWETYSFESHLTRLGDVLDRIAAQSVKVAPKNVLFFQNKVSFLGHIVSHEGIAADPEKIESVKMWPIPKTITDVRSFLGTCSYYRKFIQNFANIAQPLHKLTEKNCLFEWTDERNLAFQKLKNALISSPILGYPDMSKTLILNTDASGFGIEAVLSQIHDGVEYEAFTLDHKRINNPKQGLRKIDETEESDDELVTRPSKIDDQIGTLSFNTQNSDKIGNFKVTHKSTIVNIDVPAVIGYDFLHQYECTFELGKGVLIIGQNYIHCIKESQTESVFKVSITEKLTIPPNTEVITSCAIKGDASSIMNAMTQALPSKHTDNLLIAKAVVDPSCGQIPIRMANITDFEEIIHPDTHVALCEAVEVNFDSAHADINKLMNVTSFDESKEIPSHLTDLRERSSELLSEDQISQLDKLLIKYDTTFSKNKSDLGRASAIKHTISSGNAKLIKQAPRRLPLSKRDEVNDEIQRLLHCGVIELRKVLGHHALYQLQRRVMNEDSSKSLPWCYKTECSKVTIPATPFAGTERVKNRIRPYNADLSARPKVISLDNKTKTRSPNSPQEQHIDIAADSKRTASLTTSLVTISLGIENHNVTPIKTNLLTLFDLPKKIVSPIPPILRSGKELLTIIQNRRTVATWPYLTRQLLSKARNGRDFWLPK
ncbi:unnamed protein product [Mytilus coruscus]|uniref:Reverse transcriptase domain-containing protein n=1 Tax=Mytilus coruscus TaxID=42192 RepID=A0A6J8BP27_MYTCO|nr:unnamed protein product [Mytilus coruscus]